MAFFDPSRPQDFVFISGTKVFVDIPFTFFFITQVLLYKSNLALLITLAVPAHYYQRVFSVRLVQVDPVGYFSCQPKQK